MPSTAFTPSVNGLILYSYRVSSGTRKRNLHVFGFRPFLKVCIVCDILHSFPLVFY